MTNISCKGPYMKVLILGSEHIVAWVTAIISGICDAQVVWFGDSLGAKGAGL
jgi:hypothetical protein